MTEASEQRPPEDWLQQYMMRIGMSEPVSLTEAGLTRLHLHQHQAIPFENMDVLAQKPIRLDPLSLYQKLVRDSRGGYCFELNGLLLNVLEAIGFNARPVLGRVHLGEQPTGRGHQVTVVELNGQQWLVDVGFGGTSPRAPLPLVLDEELSTDLQTFRFIEDCDFGWLLQLFEDGQWINLYSLDMAHVCLGDIEYGNHYSSTSPNSIFTHNSIAARATVDGSVTLLNRTLKVKKVGEVKQQELVDEQSYLAALSCYFGLEGAIDFQSIVPFLDGERLRS